jgi:hypothetical protein
MTYALREARPAALGALPAQIAAHAASNAQSAQGAQDSRSTVRSTSRPAFPVTERYQSRSDGGDHELGREAAVRLALGSVQAQDCIPPRAGDMAWFDADPVPRADPATIVGHCTSGTLPPWVITAIRTPSNNTEPRRVSGSSSELSDRGRDSGSSSGHPGRHTPAPGRSPAPRQAWSGPGLGPAAPPRPASRSHRCPTCAPR